MTKGKLVTEVFTAKQRSLLSFNFEEDPDLWLILLAEHFDIQEEFHNIAPLKAK